MAQRKKIEKDNFIKFLGTAGARFVMLKQLRASAGIWINFSGTNILIDPGPGSLVKCLSSRPKLDPAKLDAVLLTHRHLDHANDVNVILEAITEGGFKKRGVLFTPSDAIEAEPIILRHLREIVHIELLKPHTNYEIGGIKFSTGMCHIHSTETYGFKFNLGEKTVSLISDTRYFDGLSDFYKADIVIINVVFYEPHPQVDHLSLEDAEKIINDLRPHCTILTHFGMTMLKAKPHLLEEELSRRLKIKVVCAYDGMTVKI
ncbi:MAG: MBL fold metallo-hydrolase [Candidatus Omnitrophota bacterium]